MLLSLWGACFWGGGGVFLATSLSNQPFCGDACGRGTDVRVDHALQPVQKPHRRHHRPAAGAREPGAGGHSDVHLLRRVRGQVQSHRLPAGDGRRRRGGLEALRGPQPAGGQLLALRPALHGAAVPRAQRRAAPQGRRDRLIHRAARRRHHPRHLRRLHPRRQGQHPLLRAGRHHRARPRAGPQAPAPAGGLLPQRRRHPHRARRATTTRSTSRPPW